MALNSLARGTLSQETLTDFNGSSENMSLGSPAHRELMAGGNDRCHGCVR